MPKGGKGRSNKKKPEKTSRNHKNDDSNDMMDDEIDAFHKQRDIVPLDVNDDIGESDEDDEQPVFDIEDDDEEDDDEEFEDEGKVNSLAAKIARQKKYLQVKMGGVEDETRDDNENGEEKSGVWGRKKAPYYGDEEGNSSDDEEQEVLRIQKQQAKVLSKEDYGLDDDDDSDDDDKSEGEPTMEEISERGKKPRSQDSTKKESQDDIGTEYEEVKKDLNALSREEQMDVVFSSAPELVSLLSELNDSIDQLENKVNPLLEKVRDSEKEGMKYIELKKQLLLSYCQAITFYLLLKSEGQPVRDHPVISRLVEIKNLLDKTKKLDENLPSNLDEIIGEKMASRENDFRESESLAEDKPSTVSAEAQPYEVLDLAKDNENKVTKRKRQNDQAGSQSMEMQKVRAALEEKLKQKGLFSSITPKHGGTTKNLKPVNGQLETLDDFDDETIDVDARRDSSVLRSSNYAISTKKAKIISGDDDLPKRDEIGERRRRHEVRVLSGAGIKSDDYDNSKNTLEEDDDEFDADAMEDDDEESDSDLDLYNQVEKQRAAKLAAKDEKYSRNPTSLSMPDETIEDGKRSISSQIEKNRGLTRSRKKSIKNPRKKYKEKHKKWEERRKGQVRNVKKPSGPYGGESSGINPGISKSVRFK